jgi:hypothetical protein
MADQMKFLVTPAQIEVAREKLAEAGFNLAGDTGVLQKDGYRIGYAVEQGRLILDLLANPTEVLRSTTGLSRLEMDGSSLHPSEA